MPSALRDDRRLTRAHIQAVSANDQLADFFAYLRYPEDARLEMTPDALQLPQRLKDVTRRIERLTSVEGGALQVYLFELTSVTVAHTRALARAFRNRAGNFLLVLTDDYERIDYVLLEREVPGLTDTGGSRRGVTVRPRVLSVKRREPDRVALRVLRRFTFTEYDGECRRDPYAQWDKLKSAYTVAEWSEPLFNNRALFSDYYLNERLPDHPAWDSEGRNRAFRAVRETFAGARRRFAGEDAATIRSKLIRPLLETLGFRVEAASAGGDGGSGKRAVPDFLLYTDGQEEPAAFVLAYPWNRYLDGKDDKRDDERPEENPGAQVVTLLEAGTADWGIVTNGKTWRLYSSRAHSRATNTYEVNLEETLASPEPGELFRYFYLFFRAEAFAPEERPVAGETRELTFLDWLMEESQTYAQELGERLKERVFEEIFPHFAAGFIHTMGGPERFLALPEEEREAELDRVYQGTLTFLYRLLFLLYAESRDLLPVREVRGYHRISLRRLSEEIAEQAGSLEDLVPRRLEEAYPLPSPGTVIPSEAEGSREESRLYDRLLDLFRVIDEGSPARNVPTYNGGLFISDPDEDLTGREAEAARFLEETSLPDRYLALGLDRLARDVDPKRGDLGFIDYKSLGVRQLGSIYEGLLEFRIEIPQDKAVDRPSSFVIRLISDKGERKATGSYYTPDYIVKYIVRHTVGPVLDEKLDALGPRLHEAEQRFRKVVKRKVELEGVTPDEPMLLQNVAGEVLHDLFDVKVLDPAMGSGHFLVEAVDYVTDRLVRFLDGFPFLGVFFEGMRRSILEEMERQKVTVDPAQLTDVTLLKRHVLKRCIYGVDLNPMAVELAKVSLWLDCFTLGAPLSFLDHHLRWGNSLIGAMAQEVEEEMAESRPDGQMTFLTGPFTGLLRAAEIMRGISTIADVTLEQVRESGHLFDAFDEAATPYKQLLDIHVARHFGVKRAEEFLTLYGAEAMEAQSEELRKPYREVVERTRELYEEKRFFHWDLEFPEVFIDLERAAWKKDGGFDAVVGNPPYVRVQQLPHSEIDYYKRCFRSAYRRVDVSILFFEVALCLIAREGKAAYIASIQFFNTEYGRRLREMLLRNTMHSVFSFGSLPVFEGATTYPGMIVFSSGTPKPFMYSQLSELPVSGSTELSAEIQFEIDPADLSDDAWEMADQQARALLRRLREASTFGELSEFAETWGGVITGRDEVYNLERSTVDDKSIEPNILLPLVRSPDVDRWFVDPSMWLLYPYKRLKSCDTELIAESELERDYPNTLAYLRSYEQDLRERRDSRKAVGNAADWYRIIRYGSHHLFESEKILTPGESRANSFAIDRSGAAFSFARVYAVIAKTVDIGFLAAVLNTTVLEFALHSICPLKSGGYYTYSSTYLAHAPIRRIRFTTGQSERERLTSNLIFLYDQQEFTVLLTEIDGLLPRNEDGSFLAFHPDATGAEEKSDVVHDLLAYLAEQMIAMHKEKQERVDAFWNDLEAACESPSTFEELHEHGKWEQSLWKDSACRPYVDRESRSTRHLHESLAWDDACFEAFAGMLAGKTSVTPPMMDVYRKHHTPYKTLVERIVATDDLIDQIVYRLYGLTEEEIAVVEGRTTSH